MLIVSARRLGSPVATEAASDGLAMTFAPMLDVARDPRWGRSAEGPGEGRFIVDADLSGRRAMAIWYDVAKELDLGRVPGSPAVTKKGPLSIVELARSYEDGFVVSAEAVEQFARKLPEHGLVVVDAPQPFAATVRPFIMSAAKITR